MLSIGVDHRIIDQNKVLRNIRKLRDMRIDNFNIQFLIILEELVRK